MRRAKTKAVLLVLIASAFPLVWAVQRARETAARDGCESALKQIGLGFVNYASVYDTFPGGTVVNAGLPPEKRLSWIMSCLPFMFCPHCYGIDVELDWAKPWDAPGYRTLARTPIFPVHCPGSSRQSARIAPAAWKHVDVRADDDLYPTAFVGIAGLGGDAASLPKGSPRAGIFGYDRTTTLADLKDGAGSTMAVAETSELAGSWVAGGFPTVRGLDPARKPYVGPGRSFGANHRGGVMVLFADGSVRFLRESIAPTVFEALSTVAGGEPLPAGWDR